MQIKYFKICYRDRVPTVLVKEWPLVCTMFTRDSIMGPVPTLLDENIEVKEENFSLGQISKFNLNM
jgi:hypothetical protein